MNWLPGMAVQQKFLMVLLQIIQMKIMMCLLKIARTKLGDVSVDTYVDMAAYGAIAGEIKFKEPREESEGEKRGRITKEYVKSLNKVMDELEEKI